MKLDKPNKLKIGLIVAVAILLARLFVIQIVDEKYKIDASNNSMVYSMIYPPRGIIHDRNGKILVGNKMAYDLLVTPKEVDAFDTTALADVLGVSVEAIREKMDGYRRNRRRIGYQSVVMFKQLPPETYLRFAEVAYKFPGFRGQARSIREYPFNAGGNLLGYVSEVDQKYIDRHKGEYSSGDYAGKTGIEAAREKELKGEKGYAIYLRNSRNKIESRYRDGAMDREAVPGKDITTTIDSDLQQYGQQLMQNKVGSLVAIEPSTGEILTLVSSPGIDVDVLADFGNHYNEILGNPYKPMFNRAVQAPYPPGSVFKLVNGLIGLQEGVLTPDTEYPCSMGYHFGRNRLGCHAHRSPLDLEESIMMSCNAYYCYVLRNILENDRYGSIGEAMDRWNEYVKSFGFGRKLGSDFPSELGGTIPDAAYYDKVYGKGRWKATTVISLSIGQGELLLTPLQIANMACILANRGYYMTPHIVRPNASTGTRVEKHLVDCPSEYFPPVIEGMVAAASIGTARGAAIDSVEICAKTGTAQNPHGDDHSIVMIFAPKEKPRIAMAVYIENAGFGARYAVPIAGLILEKYLKGDISPEHKALEKRMIESNLIDTPPVSAP